MKTCFKCHIAKPLEEFYSHPQTADGRLNKCKTCTKADMARDRRENPRVRAYDRERAKLPHRAALRKRICEAWDKAFPDRAKAQQAASNAVRAGKLARVTVCEGCGRIPARIEKHHPDYSQPLLIMWLCKPCHAIADKVRRKTEKASA